MFLFFISPVRAILILFNGEGGRVLFYRITDLCELQRQVSLEIPTLEKQKKNKTQNKSHFNRILSFFRTFLEHRRRKYYQR